jgi:hypothetical protein
MFGFTQKYGTFASFTNYSMHLSVLAPKYFSPDPTFWIRILLYKTWPSKLLTNVSDSDLESGMEKKIRIQIWDLFYPGSGIDHFQV